jgi:hypothetical protein
MESNQVQDASVTPLPSPLEKVHDRSDSSRNAGAPIVPDVVRPAVDLRCRKRSGLIALLAAGLVAVVGMSGGAYVAHDVIEKQRAEINVLVTNLATTSVERDDLLTARDRLTGARDQLTSDVTVNTRALRLPKLL